MDPMLVECVSVRPFKLLARSPPTSTRRRDMEGEQRNGGGEREREEITIKCFCLSSLLGFVECRGPAVNRSRKFSPLISAQRSERARQCARAKGRSMIGLHGGRRREGKWSERRDRDGTVTWGRVTTSKFIPTNRRHWESIISWE